ncbi:N-acyl homoserine lactonase family protein [Rhodococcus sp. IEGM 1366]|uniref:N-acyl homoserine lactonase family protein n=1 Tax=Rhodococcus sp. IEGM 1366 TaxID=3082223 RepID=UPI002954FB70|nr:N-acyl homoserine lactonase family protein [Rhodococcus sp. IEGM 1366]MDV8070714.1 N-acyl homoserine lactonase family protein [Rhodococcus sp. IEGM 1366]
MSKLVQRIALLTLGWEDLPKSVSVFGSPSSERLVEPTPAVLAQLGDGTWALLDTGFNTALVRDPALYERFYPNPDYSPSLPSADDEPLLTAFESAGLTIDEISMVALSHLHHDHAGGLKLFAGRVPIHLQRRELERGLDVSIPAEHEARARIDYDDPRIDWHLADGLVELAPGLTAIPTYGHTVGHQSFMVELDPSVGGGGYIFAFDAADLTENIEEELPLGGFIGSDPSITIPPIRKLKALAMERGFILVPGHDPNVWPALTASLADRFKEVR